MVINKQMKKIEFIGIFFLISNLFFSAVTLMALAPVSYSELETGREFQEVYDRLANQLLETDDPEKFHAIVQEMIQLVKSAQAKGVSDLLPLNQAQIVAHMWNRFLEYAMANQLDQPIVKRLIAFNPGDYEVLSNDLTFPFRVIYAKGRATRPVADPNKTPEPVQSELQTGMMWSYREEGKPYKPQKERFFPILINGQIYQWFPNIYPTVKSNTLLVPYVEQFTDETWHRQRMTRDHLFNVWKLNQTMDGMVMALNTMGRGGASVNELHFHTVWLDQLPEILNHPNVGKFKKDSRYLIDHVSENAQTVVQIGNQLHVKQFYDEFVSGYELSGESDELLVDAVMKMVDYFHQQNIHYTVIIHNHKIFLFMISPLERERTPENFEFFGWAEKFGLFMTLDEPQFDRSSTKDKIQSLMDGLKYPKEPSETAERQYLGFDQIQRMFRNQLIEQIITSTNSFTQSEYQSVFDQISEWMMEMEQPAELNQWIQLQIQLLKKALTDGVETLIPNNHDELHKHIWFAYLRYANRNQQQEPNHKKLVAVDPEGYQFIVDETLVPYRVIVAKGRATRPKQKRYDFKLIDDTQTPMMWSKKPQNERMFPVLLNGRIYQWVPNIYPITNVNSLLIPYMDRWTEENWQRQLITQEHLANSWQLYQTKMKKAVMGLNTMGRGGGSVNDLHFQVLWLDEVPDSFINKEAGELKIDQITRESESVYQFPGVVSIRKFNIQTINGFIVEGVNQEAIISMASDIIEELNRQEIFYNLMYYQNKIYIYLVSSDTDINDPDNRVMGFPERFGIVVFENQEQYENHKSTQLIDEWITRYKFSNSRFEKLADQIKDKIKKTIKGFMHRQEDDDLQANPNKITQLAA